MLASILPSKSLSRRESRLYSVAIHNIVVEGRRISVRVEPVMWQALQDIARRQQDTVYHLVTEISRGRTAAGLTARIRVYIVDFYRATAQHALEAQAVEPPGLPI